MIAVLVPVLGRPDRAAALAENLAAATSVPHRLLFMCTPGDDAQIAACEETGADVLVLDQPRQPGDFARKQNAGYHATTEPYVFLGADDLRFHPGWDTAALEIAEAYDVGVVGTNDLGNALVRAGHHATHSLVARCYADTLGTIDEPGQVLHEGYDHQYVDNELVETAQARGCFAFAPDSIVEHLHPFWGKGRLDDTYRAGLAQGNRDRRLFHARRRLWARLAVPA